MRVPKEAQAIRYIKSIKQNLAKLETLIQEPQTTQPNPKPLDKRTEVLEQIYVLGVIEQTRLFRILDDRRIPHTWIGAQSRAGYLEMWSAAGGNILYRTTERAVQELSLGRMLPHSEFSHMSNSAFGEDWNSHEDQAYDRL